MANEKIKVKRYEVYMGNSSVIIPAVGCFLVEDKLSFINASGEVEERVTVTAEERVVF